VIKERKDFKRNGQKRAKTISAKLLDISLIIKRTTRKLVQKRNRVLDFNCEFSQKLVANSENTKFFVSKLLSLSHKM
jgi:hypothetical protein